MKRKILALFSTLFIFFMVSGPFFASANPVFQAEPAALGGPAEMHIRVLEDEAVIDINPDTNYYGNNAGGGLWIGRDGIDQMARSWMKYNLSHIPKEIGYTRVYLNAFLNTEFMTDIDEPIAVHYAANDTWSETTITWNLQTPFDASPLDVIDSPATPDMFEPATWYQWDVTTAFTDALSNDKMLSLVMKQVNESAPDITWKYFIDYDFTQLWAFNATYLSVEYTTPDAVDLAVDGHMTSPLVDYIQDSTPNLEWGFSGTGIGDFQRDYELEVWDNADFNDTLLWMQNNTDLVTIHDSGGGTNSRPFGTADAIRYQMKYSDSLFTRSGVVDKLMFGTEALNGTIVFENLQILMLGVQDALALAADFETNYDGVQPISVLNVPSYEAEIVNGWITIDIENIYFLHGRYHQIIELRFTNNTGTLTGAPLSNAAGGSVAYTWGAGAETSYTADWLYDRLHNTKIVYETDLVNDPGVGAANAYPFGTDIGHPGRFQIKYNVSLIPETGLIDKIWFPVYQFSTDVVYENLVIRLGETPRLGELSHTDFESNYAGVTPVTVLDESSYYVRNLGGVLVLDLEDVFHYNGEHDLLIDMQWDDLSSGFCTVMRNIETGAYRAWNTTYYSTNYAGNDTSIYNMYLDFVHNDESIEYAGTGLVNATEYYWRVRVCDSLGIWSDWTTHSFKYEQLSSTPDFSVPLVDPSPAVVNIPVTVSINVTYFLGINGVWLEVDGSNHSMTVDGDTYSYTMTPSAAGNVSFTIYMESNIGTWSSTSGIIEVVSPGFVLDGTTLLIIAAAAGVVIVIVLILILRNRGKK